MTSDLIHAPPQRGSRPLWLQVRGWSCAADLKLRIRIPRFRDGGTLAGVRVGEGHTRRSHTGNKESITPGEGSNTFPFPLCNRSPRFQYFIFCSVFNGTIISPSFQLPVGSGCALGAPIGRPGPERRAWSPSSAPIHLVPRLRCWFSYDLHLDDGDPQAQGSESRAGSWSPGLPRATTCDRCSVNLCGLNNR